MIHKVAFSNWDLSFERVLQHQENLPSYGPGDMFLLNISLGRYSDKVDQSSLQPSQHI